MRLPVVVSLPTHIHDSVTHTTQPYNVRTTAPSSYDTRDVHNYLLPQPGPPVPEPFPRCSCPWPARGPRHILPQITTTPPPGIGVSVALHECLDLMDDHKAVYTSRGPAGRWSGGGTHQLGQVQDVARSSPRHALFGATAQECANT